MDKNEIRELINNKKFSEALKMLLRYSLSNESTGVEDKWFLAYELGLVNKKLGNISIAKFYTDTSLGILKEQGDMYEFYRVEKYLTLWLDTELNKDSLTFKELYKRYTSIYRLFKEFNNDNIYKIAIMSNIAIMEKDYLQLSQLYELANCNNYVDLSIDIYKEMKNIRKEMK